MAKVHCASSRPSDQIIRSASDIARQRLLHAATRMVARVLPSKTTKEVEFEYRYRRYLAEYGASDSDIIISTFSKSGTTWCQIVLYQLTTSGDMDFDHLFDISPWVWYSAMREVQPMITPSPRILKSHDDYRRFRGGCRDHGLHLTHRKPNHTREPIRTVTANSSYSPSRMN